GRRRGVDRRAERLEAAHETLGERRLEARPPRRDLADRAYELTHRRVLQEPALRARAHGAKERIRIVERGQDDARHGSAERLEDADPAAPRHAQVEERDVGARVAQDRERLLAVARLAGHREVRLELEQAAQALAHDRLVLDDYDPELRHARLAASVA